MGRSSRGKSVTLWEERMIAEYLAKFHPKATVTTRIRLGPFGTSPVDPNLSPEEQRMVGASFRRWADAMMVERDQVWLIEAALIPDPQKISLLQVYLHLFPLTPELHDLKQLTLKGVLLFAMDDPYTTTVANKAGLQVIIYKPSFLLEYLTLVRSREAKKSRPRVTVRA